VSQVEKLVEALEEKYKIDISAFLELYQSGYPREDIASELHCGEWCVRAVATALNLRMAKKFRNHDYTLYLSRYSDEADSLIVNDLATALDDLDQLSRDLVAKEKNLLLAKSEVAKYRRVLRQEAKQDAVNDMIADAVNKLADDDKPSCVLNYMAVPSDKFAGHIQFMLLSDLHFESVVSEGDVGKVNTYTWEIAEQRLAKVFESMLNAHRGERSCVIMGGGDFLDGLIHNSLETSSKPLGKAVTDLAMLLAGYLKGLSEIYDTVYVPVVSGNHERLTDFKRSHNQGYGFAYMLYEMLTALVADKTNIRVEISTTGYLAFGVGTKVVGLTHGDFIKGPTNDVKILKYKEAFRQVTGYTPNHIFSGHTHQPEVKLFGNNDYYIVSGSLIGANAYSVTNGMTNVDWSQPIGAFTPDGAVDYVKFVG
jgi:predicted phosphodiesterase